ncbi:hypothetical protein HOLleu_03637 [Holothuria leucospilota]|uniref:Reverse transcriptase n=1 Tax=Holothuria leucospilota TaxID=206669 RepID=A0A9Q1CR06_HOLLE|nr:hypothetical protein HOLleu_03637 [Holothuria leucospilota]
MDIEKLTEIGKSLGLGGENLIKFIQEKRDVQNQIRIEQQKIEREKRAHEREMKAEEKEILDKQLELVAMEKEKSDSRQSQGEVNISGGTSHAYRAKAPKLPHFNEGTDDLDAYLQRFERYSRNQGWDRKEWATNLSALLHGKALDIYSRMPFEESGDYDTLKAALLKGFQLTDTGFRDQFRSARPVQGETAQQFAVRLRNFLTRWVDMVGIKKTYDELVDLLLTEQFLESVNLELRLFLKERKPKNLEAMATFADQYADAHGSLVKLKGEQGTRVVDNRSTNNQGQSSDRRSGRESKQGQTRRPQTFSGRNADFSRGSRNANVGQTTASRNSSRTCFLCGRVGHFARDCRSRPKEISKVASLLASLITDVVGENSDSQTNVNISGGQQNTSDTPRQGAEASVSGSDTVACMISNQRMQNCCTNEGYVELKCGHAFPLMSVACGASTKKMPVSRGLMNGKVVQVLRDSGCTGVVVRRDLVLDKQLTGEERTCILVDGTVRTAAVASIHLDTPFWSGVTEAICIQNPVFDVILGNLEGIRGPNDPDPRWKLESNDGKAYNCSGEDGQREQANAVKTRLQTANEGTPMKKLTVPKRIPDISREELLTAQKADPTLFRTREMAAQGTVKTTRFGHFSKFYWSDGLLYREFKSPKFHFGEPISQLVIPKKFMDYVLRLAHESILGGHLGSKKTFDKLATNFFWPGVQAEVTHFCRSCDACQRTLPKGRAGKAPLGNMPLIGTPWQRIAMDLVGPIAPHTERGNRYILTIVDYATRYPEAIPLPNIETVRVAEALIEVFSRVGLPAEILSDRGAQFTSGLMHEVNRLLSIRQLLTTPYHPACNGLVERFNATLKQMLKKLCIERPKDWDRYLAPLLFAYPEAPQSSTGFSPFELLFGRNVRGPMTILRELWTGETTDDETKTTYQYILDLRQRLEDTCEMARNELQKAGERSKFYYDRRTREKNFKVGNKVLLLLPTDENKLLMHWKGPFKVKEKLGNLNYRIEMSDGKTKVFHANLLKKYHERPEPVQTKENVIDVVSVSVSSDVLSNSDEGYKTQFDNDDVLVLPGIKPTETITDVVTNPNLSDTQTLELNQTLRQYQDILTDLPGRTTLGQHEIQLTSDDPVHQKPYPLPFALRQTIKREIDFMLDLGVIEPSNSPYSSPIVIVEKKDGSNCFCVDFRCLNKITVFDAEPIPNPEEIFANLSEDMYFTRLDLSKGYWQLPLRVEDKPKTAFIAPNGLFQFCVMPFGLVNSSASFSRLMRVLLKDLQHVHNYIDDILIHTKSWKAHLDVLDEVLQQLRKANLTVRPSKCAFCFNKTDFLGHVVGNGELAPHSDKLIKVKKAKRPHTKKQLRSFLGLANYYRKFIPNYAEIACPLTDMTKKREPNHVKWGSAQENAFETLKSKLISAPILHLPDCSKPFILRTDASQTGVGAVLLQDVDGQKFPVGYASKKLLEREKACSTIEKECLALVWAIQKFQVYLYGKAFVLETDHQPLIYMQKAKLANAHIMRWALSLQPFRIQIRAIKGSDNVGADFLSRVD